MDDKSFRSIDFGIREDAGEIVFVQSGIRQQCKWWNTMQKSWMPCGYRTDAFAGSESGAFDVNVKHFLALCVYAPAPGVEFFSGERGSGRYTITYPMCGIHLCGRSYPTKRKQIQQSEKMESNFQNYYRCRMDLWEFFESGKCLLSFIHEFDTYYIHIYSFIAIFAWRIEQKQSHSDDFLPAIPLIPMLYNRFDEFTHSLSCDQ